jgi:hypothetical protein
MYTNSFEISFLLDELNFCTESYDEKSPGDIITIRKYFNRRKIGRTPSIDDFINYMDQFEEVHGFTYISDELSFSKNGVSRFSPYMVQSLEGVFKYYGVKSEDCWFVRRDDIAKQRSCKVYGNVYKCRIPKSFLDNRLILPEDIKNKKVYYMKAIEKFRLSLRAYFFETKDAMSIEKIYITYYQFFDDLQRYYESKIMKSSEDTAMLLKKLETPGPARDKLRRKLFLWSATEGILATLEAIRASP